MSNEQPGAWRIPANDEPDEFWERLGRGDELGESEQWTRVDGMLPGATVYFRRELSDAGPSKVTGISIVSEDGLNADMMRAVPMVRLENFDEAYFADLAPEDLEPLRRDEYPDADEFSRAVAFAYRYFAARSTTPGKELAAHAGVPVATARRWIHEARLRGHLAPGRRGKAG